MGFYDLLLASAIGGGGGSNKAAFDETGEEYQVGFYKLANGTKKPLYRKDLMGTAAGSDAAWATLGTISNLEAIIYASGVINISATEQRVVPNLTSSIERSGTSVTFYCNSTAMYGKDVKASVYYTKTSDTPA